MKKIDDLKIINTVFRFEISKGHLKWRVTEVARYSGVSRTLIYYHFGKTKKDIFDRCLDIIMNDFYGLSEERDRLARAGKLFECVKAGYDIFHRSPEFMVFYFYWRFKKSPIQERLIQIEKAYQNRLKYFFPHLKPHQVSAAHAAIQGIITAPFLNKNDFEFAIKQIVSPFLHKSLKL